MLETELNDALFQTWAWINPSVCSPSLLSCCPAVFWSNELSLLISSNRALIKEAEPPELVERPRATTFKSYTLCCADSASLTWWKRGRTLCSHVYSPFSPPRQSNASFKFLVILLCFFSLFIFLLSAPDVAIKAELPHNSTVTVVFPNKTFHVLFSVPIICLLGEKSTENQAQASLIGNSKHNYWVMKGGASCNLDRMTQGRFNKT